MIKTSIRFFDFLHAYVLELLVCAFMILFLFWAFGYFANGLYGMKFDLQSCWGGFSAIGGAGTLAAIKYIMDSWKNTPEGEAPTYKKALQGAFNAYAGSDKKENVQVERKESI